MFVRLESEKYARVQKSLNGKVAHDGKGEALKEFEREGREGTFFFFFFLFEECQE